MKAVFTWELGAGMGHATRLRPLAENLIAAGTSVKCFAIRRQDAAGQLPCPVEQAPWLKPPKRANEPWIGHLADSLAALGWDQANHLSQTVQQWRELLEREQPDALVMDSAPASLLASQGLPIKRVWLANGWSTPTQSHRRKRYAESALTLRFRITPLGQAVAQQTGPIIHHSATTLAGGAIRGDRDS